MWAYKGIDVFRAAPNSSGIRWYARTPWGRLRAGTKQSMRELISATLADNGVTSFSYGRR